MTTCLSDDVTTGMMLEELMAEHKRTQMKPISLKCDFYLPFLSRVSVFGP